MASNFPASLDSLTNPLAADTLDSPSHSGQHINSNDIIEAIETNLGTNSGTSVLKHFTAGQFPIRATGVAATGTLQQTIVSGTYNNTVIGTPDITGGTATSSVLNSSVVGTPAITGGTATNLLLTTPSFSSGAINTADVAASAITRGSQVIAAAGQNGTITNASSWTNISNRMGTLVTLGGVLFAEAVANYYFGGAAGNVSARIRGTSDVGTFFVPGVNGFAHPYNAVSVYENLSVCGVATGVAAGTYIVSYQGSISAGSMFTDTSLYLPASVLEFLR